LGLLGKNRRWTRLRFVSRRGGVSSNLAQSTQDPVVFVLRRRGANVGSFRETRDASGSAANRAASARSAALEIAVEPWAFREAG
jgi:hypothetical protein